MIEVVSRPKKRLFLTLILISFFLTGLSVYAIWVVSFPGLSNIHSYLPLTLGILLAMILLGLAIGVGGIILAILNISTLGTFQKLAWSAVNILFPLAITIGKVFEVDKERVERSFIEVSNHLILKKRINIKPENLLILTPHCIQQETCPHKITRDVLNCRRCGQCQVGELLDIAQSYGANLAVVTGGTLARKAIKTLKPQAVLAIACERDLTSGIQDTFPLPVIGILNQRPCGPCCNTRVDIDKVKKAIENLCA